MDEMIAKIVHVCLDSKLVLVLIFTFLFISILTLLKSIKTMAVEALVMKYQFLMTLIGKLIHAMAFYLCKILMAQKQGQNFLGLGKMRFQRYCLYRVGRIL